ncbi:RHS repeat-associated core domain-containing protein [Spongiactinospora sp. 9N601]|uniref:RHS repeat-associated core domain-containing protein n=1 Tax=Spongiactinospora sp. 9N601 TaxID=3375149 RepID=UPI0037B1ABA0
MARRVQNYCAEYYPGGFLPGQPTTNNRVGKLAFELVNCGDFAWNTGSVRLGYWVYDMSGNLISKDGARTSFKSDVPPGWSVTFTADLGPLSPGDGTTKSRSYKVAWNLLEGESTWFSERGVISPVVTYTVFNQFPTLTIKGPANEAAVTTTRPTLSVEGGDPDAYPGRPLEYRFTICARSGATSGQCRDSAWTTSTSHVPPMNTLYWNTLYEWSVAVRDGLDTTAATVSNWFTTVVPNPDQAALYGSGAGDAQVAGVNLPAGNFTTQAPQITVPSYGIPMVLAPTYNSLDRREGSFGVGWSSILDMRMDRDPGGLFMFTHPDGRQERFGCNGQDGTFSPSIGSGTRTRIWASGNTSGNYCGGLLYVYVGPAAFVFDQEGRLRHIENRFNELDRWQFEYTDADAPPTRISHPITGRGFRLTWSAGTVTKVEVFSQPAGQPLQVLSTWAFESPGESTSERRLRKIIPPVGDSIHYLYNGQQLLHQIWASDGQRWDGLQQIWYFTSGRVDFVSVPGGIAWRFAYTHVDGGTLPREVVVTNPRGLQATWKFDSAYHLVQRIGENGGTRSWVYWPGADGPTGYLSHVIDENSNIIHTSYSRGRLSGRSVYAGDDEESVQYTYYGYGSNTPQDPRFDQLSAMTDARGAGVHNRAFTTEFEYDERGRLTNRKDPPTSSDSDGQGTSYFYTDGLEQAYGAPAGRTMPAGLLHRVISLGSVDVEYSYDERGQLRETREHRQDTAPSGSGARTVYDYDDAGRLISRTVHTNTVAAPVTTAYAYDAVGNLTRETGPRVRNRITGAYHQQQADYLYDTMFRLVKTTVSDLTGEDPARITSYVYGNDNRVKSITYPDGGTIAYAYDQNGNLTRTTNQLGTVTEMAYNQRDQLISVVLKGFNDTPDADDSSRDVYLAQYAYDLGGRLTRETDALGRTRAHTYLPNDRLDTVTLVGFRNADGTTRNLPIADYDYDAAGNVVKTTEFGTRVTTTEYDALSRPLKIVEDPGGVNRTRTFGYDTFGHLAWQRLSDGSGRTEETRFEYEVRGLVKSRTTENGGIDVTTSFSYDDWGLLTKVTDPLGNVATFAYDELGRRVTETAPSVEVEEMGKPTAWAAPQTVTGYNAFGQVTHTRDPRGYTALSDYDAAGRRTRFTGPPQPAAGGGTVTPTGSWAYDKLGNVLEETDLRGQTVSYRYDKLGRLYKKTDPLLPSAEVRGSTLIRYDDAGNVIAVTDSIGAAQEWTYDDLNRVAASTDVTRQAGNDVLRYSTRYFYDDIGNLTRTLTPGGLEVRRTYDALGQLRSETLPGRGPTSFDYDAAGRTTKVTDPLGRAVTSAYDLAGRLIEHRRLAPFGDVLATQRFEHDLAGNVTSVISPRGNTTEYVYDPLNRLLGAIEPLMPNGQSTTQFAYDAAGNQTKVTDGRGNTTWTTYTPGGQVASVVEPSTSAHPALLDRTWTSEYDAGGLPVKLTKPGGVSITRTYDPLGRLTSEAGSGGGATSATRTWRYDGVGRVIAVGHPRSELRFDYDDRGLLLRSYSDDTARFTAFGYDADGRLTARGDPNISATNTGYTYSGADVRRVDDHQAGISRTYDRNLAGEATKVTHSDGVTRNIHRDDFGRVTFDATARGGSSISTLLYGYDVDGNVTHKYLHGPQSARFGGGRYIYDAAGRLSTWEPFGGDDHQKYGYDVVGNLTRIDKVDPDSGQLTQGPARSYDQRNRLTSIGSQIFEYTPRGTLATSGSTPLTFDAFDRMVGDGATSYTYDSLDRVATRGSTDFFYEGFSEEITEDGTHRYLRGLADEPLSTAPLSGGAASRYVTDHHGDVVATYASTGAPVLTGYDPYGAPGTAPAPGSQALGYQGEWTDPATGRVNMHARWYTPGTATFASRDNAPLPPVPAAGANQYGYAGANPLSATDPTGHFLQGLFGAVQSAIDAAFNEITAGMRWLAWKGRMIIASHAVRSFLMTAARQTVAAVARVAAGSALAACFASVVCGTVVVVGGLATIAVGGAVYYFSRQPDGSLTPVTPQPAKPNATPARNPKGTGRPKGNAPRTGTVQQPTSTTGTPSRSNNGGGDRPKAGKPSRGTRANSPGGSGEPIADLPKPPPPPVVTTHQYTTFETSSSRYYDADYIYDRVDNWTRTYEYTITTYHDGQVERGGDVEVAWEHSWSITRTPTIDLSAAAPEPIGGNPPPVYPLTVTANGVASDERPCGDGGTIQSCLPEPVPVAGGCATTGFTMFSCTVEEPRPGQGAPANPTAEDPAPANPQPGGTGGKPPAKPPAGPVAPDPDGANGDYSNFYGGDQGGVIASAKDGVLRLAIERGPTTPRGSQMFDDAVKHFGVERIRAIEGKWISKMPSNLNTFNELVRGGLTPAEAAAATFTGKMAARYGFTTVARIRTVGRPGVYTNVEVLFTR